MLCKVIRIFEILIIGIGTVSFAAIAAVSFAALKESRVQADNFSFEKYRDL